MRLTSQQCRKARSLLKWNPRELAHKTGVSASRIEQFERGVIHLHPPENKMVVKIFEEEGIILDRFGDVSLNEKDQQKKGGGSGSGGHGSTQHSTTYTVDEEELHRMSTTEEKEPKNKKARKKDTS